MRSRSETLIALYDGNHTERAADILNLRHLDEAERVVLAPPGPETFVHTGAFFSAHLVNEMRSENGRPLEFAGRFLRREW